jgi:thymidylate synthase (FAD)
VSDDTPIEPTPAAPEALERPRVEALDAILGRAFRVLDDGFVRLVDYMGGDGAVVQAARVSYGIGTKRVQEDRGLIRYLMRHAHSTPFEMCEVKLHVRVPMDTWRQWIRHRTANVNEYSTRYSIAIDAAQRTAPGDWRTQATGNRQGSGDTLPVAVGAQLSQAEAELLRVTRQTYEARIAAGVAREQARKDLPLSTYTEAYWKIDLQNLLHFLHLRMDDHAQEEIRAYAAVIGHEIVAKWVPHVWEAFLDYRVKAVHLSGIEADVMAALASGDAERARDIAGSRGLLAQTADGRLARNRERAELEAKLRTLGLRAPWLAD